jgi:hypothetical protein
LTTSSQVRVVNQKNIVMGSDGARNEEWLCWLLCSGRQDILWAVICYWLSCASLLWSSDLLRIAGDMLTKDSGKYCSTQRSCRKSKPFSRGRGDTISKHINGLGNNNNVVMDPKGNPSREWLC